MTNKDVLHDIGVVSKIPNKILKDLTTVMCNCIGSIVGDAVREGKTAEVIDIGIGTLSINLSDKLQCKFMPSKELKNAIKAGLNAPIDPLTLQLEKAMATKLIAICKETLF